MQTIYDSNDYNFDFSVINRFKIKNKEINQAFQNITNTVYQFKRIILIDKEEFYQFTVLTCNIDEIKIIELINVFNAKNLFDKYNAFDCRNTFDIIPNIKDQNFFISFFNFESIDYFNNDSELILNIICKKENVHFFLNGVKANINIPIKSFFERNVISDKEKEFIVYSYKNPKQKNIVHAVNNPSNDLFVDFMQKDDFNSSSFIITEEERKIFNPDNIKIVDGFNDASSELNKLIGLKNVKNEILKLSAKVDYKYDRFSRNIYDVNTNNLHMCFYGNPGTGKTTIARIVATILYNMGYIKKNKCIEINANEFKGSKIGETAIRTKIILRNSVNKVLFIDEAYALFDRRDGFGQEAVDTIIKEMEDNKQNMVIIFAGYKNEMINFINMNEGLKSRIGKFIEFENYNSIELCKILTSMLSSNNLILTTNAFEKTILFFKEMLLQSNFSNGRFVRNYFELIMEEHAFNVANGKSTSNVIDVNDITDNILEQLKIQNRNIQ